MQTGMARAAVTLERVNLAIIKHAAARRMRAGRTTGASPVAALAGAPVDLEVITEDRPGGKAAPITPLGYKTAVRRLPPVLAALDKRDPRRRAAVMFADAWEKIGATKGSSFEGGAPSGSGAVPDGGATTRVKHAERLRLVYEATRAREEGKRKHMITARRVPRVVLAPKRKGRGGKEIRAFDLLLAVCVRGEDMLAVLRAHGWGRRSEHRKILAQAVLEMLDDLAAAWGLGRADPGGQVDAS